MSLPKLGYFLSSSIREFRHELYDEKIGGEGAAFKVADGYGNLLDSISDNPEAEIFRLTVKDRNGKEKEIKYAAYKDTAYIDIAEIMPRSNIRNLYSTSYGIGRAMIDARERGYKQAVMSLGNSGVADAGIGLLSAFGLKFYDKDNNELEPVAKELYRVYSCDCCGFNRDMKDFKIKLIRHRDPNFVGARGTIYLRKEFIANPLIFELLERGMENFSLFLSSNYGVNTRDIEGSGCGGGILATLSAFFNTEIIDIKDFIKKNEVLLEEIKRSDIIILVEKDEATLRKKEKLAQALKELAEEENKTLVAILKLSDAAKSKLEEMGYNKVLSL